MSKSFADQKVVVIGGSMGFWERNGYHDRGDPWLEQRYQGD